MRKKLFCIVLFLLLSCGSFAQYILSGNVVSSKNSEPIPFAIVYVAELKQGIMCDNDGNFQLKLQPATYNLTFRSPGFLSTERIVNLSSNDEIRIELTPTEKYSDRDTLKSNIQSTELANDIMKQVMMLTPVYERALETYDASAYTKASIRINKLPLLIRNYSFAGIKLKNYLNKQYFKEWDLKIKYKDPNEYKQNVVAYRSSVPTELESLRAQKDRSFTSNIFGSLQVNKNDINPLRPEGLEFYDYTLENIEEQDNNMVYHIGFKQKAGLGLLYSFGDIYIESKQWNVLSLIKQTSMLGGRVKQVVNIQSSPVYENFYMPVSTSYGIHSDLIGLKGDYSYHSSIRYNRVKVNKEIANMLRKTDSLSVPKNRLRLYRQTEKLKQELAGRAVKNRDPYLVTRLPKKKLEVTIDSTATMHDDLYWTSKQTIPLTEEEKKTLAIQDSVLSKEGEFQKKKKIQLWRSLASKIFRGDQFNSVFGDNHFKFRYRGLRSALKDYNYVDGLVLGTDARLDYIPSSKFELSILPSIGYGFKRKGAVWSLETSMLFAPMQRGYANILVGQGTPDKSGNRSEASRIINSISTLLNGKGSALLMDEKYLITQVAIDITNGVRIHLEGSILEHQSLPPERVWGIFKKWDYSKIGINPPDINQNPEFILHRANTLEGTIEFNPTPFYTLNRRGRKFYDDPGVRSPLFYISYKVAVPRKKSLDSHYSRADIKVIQQIDLGVLTKLDYSVEIGSFFLDKRIYPEDRLFLSTSRNLIAKADQWERFYSMPSYTTVANNYAIARIGVKAPKLLLNRIPVGIIRRGQEQIILKSYWDIQTTPYFELGYVKNTGALSAGLFYGGHNFYRHNGFGFRIFLNF